MTMYSGDEVYEDDITSGPIDHDAERNSQWCDACGFHHPGPVGVYICENDSDD